VNVTVSLGCEADSVTDEDGDDVSLAVGWFADGVEISGATGATLAGSEFAKGQEVHCTITPNDGLVDGATVTSSTVTIRNAMPSITAATLSPAAPATDDTLTCAWTGFSDPDGDSDVSTVRWTHNGTTPATTATTYSGPFVLGDRVGCIVTPHDGEHGGVPIVANVDFANLLPVIDSVALGPDPVYEGESLTCTVGATTDPEGVTTFTYRYTWTIDGGTAIDGGEGFGSDQWSRDEDIACTAYAHDGTDEGLGTTSNVVTISNTAPTLVAVELSPSAPSADDDLSCSALGFSDADGDSDLSTWLWQVNGVNAGTDTTLAGVFGVGDTVTCTVTPHDGTDAGTPAEGTTTIHNSVPILDAVTLTPDPALSSDTFTCTPGTTTDADGTTSFTHSYGWQVGGVDLGFDTTTLGPSHFDNGDTVGCYMTPNDGVDDGPTVASNTVKVDNSIPSITGVSISPDPAGVADALTCTHSGWFDGDGDVDQSLTEWSINSLGATMGTTLSSGFVGGDVVACTVTPWDGTDEGTPLTTSLTIDNTGPGTPTISLSPTEPQAGVDPLVCSIDVEASDPDGDVVTHSFSWTVDGLAFTDSVPTTPTEDTIPATEILEDDVWACTVVADDGVLTGTSVTATVTAIAASDDLNHDAWPDLALAEFGSPESGPFDVKTYLGSASGYSTSTPVVVAQAHDLAIGDLNGDGYSDIVYASHSDGSGTYAVDSYIYFNAAGSPGSGGASPVPTVGAKGVAIADLDGDGWKDIVFANQTDGTTNDVDSLIYWGSSIGFTTSTALATVGAEDVEVIDLDGDGHLDILFASYIDGTSHAVDSLIFFGSTAGWGVATAIPTTGAVDVEIADLDGNGYLDIICVQATNGTSHEVDSIIYWGSSAGWGATSSIPTTGARDVEVGDIDGDGWLDLVFAELQDDSGYTTESRIFWGDGGSFASSSAYPVSAAWSVGICDINGDGWQDVFWGSYVDGLSAFGSSSPIYTGGSGGLSLDHEFSTNGVLGVAFAGCD
jgi:hypothetical protein